MTRQLEGRPRELIEEPNFAFVATLDEDGTPKVNPVWIDTEDGRVTLNSAEGRHWPANARREGRLTITVPNMQNPYEYVSIVGRLTEATQEGADEHIDALAKKYLDEDTYPFRQEGEVRVKLTVEPEQVLYSGG